MSLCLWLREVVHPESCKQDENGETTVRGQNPVRSYSEVDMTPKIAQSHAPALLQTVALPFSFISHSFLLLPVYSTTLHPRP